MNHQVEIVPSSYRLFALGDSNDGIPEIGLWVSLMGEDVNDDGRRLLYV